MRKTESNYTTTSKIVFEKKNIKTLLQVLALVLAGGTITFILSVRNLDINPKTRNIFEKILINFFKIMIAAASISFSFLILMTQKWIYPLILYILFYREFKEESPEAIYFAAVGLLFVLLALYGKIKMENLKKVFNFCSANFNI